MPEALNILSRPCLQRCTPRRLLYPKVSDTIPKISWFLVGNEGIRALYIPFKGLCRALIPSLPAKNQPEDVDRRVQDVGLRIEGLSVWCRNVSDDDW